MSLQTQVIDRLFARLTLTYGRAFMLQWEGLPVNDVKSTWAHELAEFRSRLDPIAWALENLPERCPNVIAFRNLARSAPRPADAPALPEPPADPARLSAELAKLAPVRSAMVASMHNTDPKAWARRIVERSKAGARVSPCALGMAHAALRSHFNAEAL
jgi:hypothetical protein